MSIRRWLPPIVIGLGSVLLLIGALQLRPSVAQPIGPLNPIGLSPEAALVAVQGPATPQHVGDTFSVTVRASQLGARLSAFQFDLAYDAGLMHYLYAETSAQLSSSGRTAICPLPVVTGNAVRIACVSSGARAGSSSDGNLAVLTFRAARAGQSALTLTNARLINDALTPTLISAGTLGSSVTITDTVVDTGHQLYLPLVRR